METDSSTVFILLSAVLAVAVAFVAGAAFCAFRRIRLIEDRVRAPLKEQIKHQAQELEDVQGVNAARNLFLASLSHELRTPLSGIAGAVRLLQDTGLNSRQREYTRMIAYASDTVLEIVDDMLTFSRIQADKLEDESASFDVRSLIDHMLSLQTIKAQERGIALIRDISTRVPTHLIGDRGKLNQILLNLIGNAIKFTDEGTVTVSVDLAGAPAPSVRTSESVNLIFTVRDTGIGVEPDEINNVFEPFVQGHGITQHSRGGTGLGLTICQRLVHAMGGEIHIDSTAGQGTNVTFRLALDRAGEPSLQMASKPDQRAPLQPLIVLVVEDDEVNRLVCTRYLALAGHHPAAAADAQQVRHLVQNWGLIPDVILMDVNLAGSSGVTLASQFATMAKGRWKGVPIVAMSADTSGRAQEHADTSGIAYFLPKPFTSEQLCATLMAAVRAESHDEMAWCTDVVKSAARGQVSNDHWLDMEWLVQEIDVLGRDTVLELLNIFRASAATTVQKINHAVDRQDWQAVGAQLHCLRGSAGNLGMRHVMSQARALQAIVQLEGIPNVAYVAEAVKQLEIACHDSADVLRAQLDVVAQKNVALTTDGDD